MYAILQQGRERDFREEEESRGIRMRAVYARHGTKLFLGSWPCHRVLGTKRKRPITGGGGRGGEEGCGGGIRKGRGKE